jgi:hypothetical protein
MAKAHKSEQVALFAHGLAALIGVAALVAGVMAFAKGLTAVLGITLIIVGGMLPTLAHFSWRFSRAAWSVMISTLCVFAAVTFFGSPKIAAVLHVGLAIAFVIPIVQVVAVIFLADLRGEYRE